MMEDTAKQTSAAEQTLNASLGKLFRAVILAMILPALAAAVSWGSAMSSINNHKRQIDKIAQTQALQSATLARVEAILEQITSTRCSAERCDAIDDRVERLEAFDKWHKK